MTVKIDGSNGLLQNYDFQTPTTGFSYTFTTFNVWFAVPAGTLATGTITMPASPVDGMTVTITSTQQITALTINANTGQSIIGGGAIQLNANTNRQYMYRLANTTWYLVNVAAGNVVTSVNGATGAVTGVGTVTSITAGGGLTGGTITSTGTIAVDTTFAAIGTYSLFWSTVSAKTYSGTTVSGSNLFYISATGSGIDPSAPAAGTITVNGNRVNATSSFTSGSGVSALTFTNVSGTWRCLGSIRASAYEACPNITSITSTLWVRVS